MSENREENNQEIEIEEATEDLIERLNKRIAELEQKVTTGEEKLKRSLADYINLERKTKADIETGSTDKIDKFLLKFLSIYDDLIRAKEVLKKEDIDVKGLEFIVKNIEALLSEYGVIEIQALGEIFDPNLHEAIAVVEDETLDESTITKEIRKGYISRKRTLRPTLVEISKKPQNKTELG